MIRGPLLFNCYACSDYEKRPRRKLINGAKTDAFSVCDKTGKSSNRSKLIEVHSSIRYYYLCRIPNPLLQYILELPIPMTRKPTHLSAFCCLFAFAILALAAFWTSSFVSSAGPSEQGLLVNSLGQTDSLRIIPLQVNDIVFNTADEKIYASIPGSAGSSGNSIQNVDPRTGELGMPVFVGSEPKKLAMANDGRSLYVALDGAFAIRKFDTQTQTPGLQFSTGYASFPLLRFKAGDLAVSPDNPNVIAVARNYDQFGTPGAGIAVFSDGAQLSQTTSNFLIGNDFLSFSSSGSTLYGTGSSSGLRTISVNASGATVTSNSNLATGSRIKFSGGRVFSSSGYVIDASSQALLGTFPSVNSSAFVPDTTVGRSYYLVRDSSQQNTWILHAFDNNTFALIGSLMIPNVVGDAASLTRWGGNGLAFRTTANQLFILQTTLIPSDEPIPTPTPTPPPTATPTPRFFETRISSVPIFGNALEYDAANQKLYVSVPSSMGSSGNSVATINPAGETLESTVFIGSEPNKLHLSSDDQTLYVGLDGSRSIRRFGIGSQEAGAVFAAGLDNSAGPLAIADFAVSPDTPGILAISRRSTVSNGFTGVAVYDNGAQRPQTRERAPQLRLSTVRQFTEYISRLIPATWKC